MNKRFFSNLYSFSKIFLIIGVIGIAIFFFTISINWTGGYSGTKGEFNPSGFAITLVTALIVAVMYSVLKGLAIIGFKLFENEAEKLMSGDTDAAAKKQPVNIGTPSCAGLSSLYESEQHEEKVQNKK
ncbi:MAG: hypothetical protein ACLRWH_04490 [Emergencia sp.]